MHPKFITQWYRDNRKNKWGYLGVSFNKKTGRFRATIRNKEKRIWCGTGSTAEEAAKKYDEMSVALFGDDAVLNFPDHRPPQVKLPTRSQRGQVEAELLTCCNLSDRQKELVRYLASGVTTAEASRMIGVAQSTCRVQLMRMRRKLSQYLEGK